MDSKPAYPIDKTYGDFIHWGLSVSWLVLAMLLRLGLVSAAA